MPDNNNEIILDVQGGASADVTLNVQRSAGGGIEMTIDPVAHVSYVDAKIDDTAGDGVTDKAWSANKVFDQLTLKANKNNAEFTGSISLWRSINERFVKGDGSIAVGFENAAMGMYSSAFGLGLNAWGDVQQVIGRWNDTLLPHLWIPNHEYMIGDEVCYPYYIYPPGGGSPIPVISFRRCKTANSDATFTSSHWDTISINNSVYAEMVGNGTNNSNRSNARLLDWNGNEFLAGDLYVGCDSDGTNGSKVVAESDVATELETQAMIDDYYGGGS